MQLQLAFCSWQLELRLQLQLQLGLVGSGGDLIPLPGPSGPLRHGQYSWLCGCDNDAPHGGKPTGQMHCLGAGPHRVEGEPWSRCSVGLSSFL